MKLGMNAIDYAVEEGVLEIIHDSDMVGVAFVDSIFQFLGVVGVDCF